MSEINANIVVENISSNINVEENLINITPEDISLRIFTGGFATAGGNINEVQYNAGGILNGSNTFTYDSTNTRVTVNNFIVTSSANLGANGNVTITGGNSGDALITNGGGSLSWGAPNRANTANTVINNAQPNITSVGTLTTLTVSGNVTANYFIGNGSQLTGIDATQIQNGNSNVKVEANSNVTISVAGNANVVTITGTGLVVPSNVAFSGANVSLGNVANLEITGGTNGYVLQTDGTGNLSWTAMTGNAGNGVVGGSNTQVQFNDAGTFAGSVGFTFDKTSNLFSVPGNINVAGTVVGNVQGPIVNLAYGVENVSLIAAQSGTYNFDLISNGIRYTTSNASANVTLNIRGNSTVTANALIGNGQSVSATYVLQNGSTPYTVSAVQIDGGAVTVKWAGGSVPTTVANALHAFTFTIVKTATTPTYSVLGSLTRYA